MERLGGSNRDEVRLKTLRSTYRGTQLAVVEVPTQWVAGLKDGERICIGYTVCRLKIVPKVTRCFRCHDFGHISTDCTVKVTDGMICRKCGGEGHSMQECTLVPACRLCVKKGLPHSKTGHVAGAINLNHCRVAQDLLIKTAEDLGVDIVFISEPYAIRCNWVADMSRKVAIWVTGLNGRKAHADKNVVGRGFVAVAVAGTYHCSCYYSPRLSDAELEAELLDLEHARGTWGEAVVVAGDFNAKSPSWGSNRLDRKGLVVVGSFDRMGLIPVKPRGKFSFQRGGRTSLIDVMACDPRTLVRVNNSVILREYSASDHQYIVHSVGGHFPRGQPGFVQGWRVETLDCDTYLDFFRNATRHINADIPLSESEAGDVIEAFQGACEASMAPRRQPPGKRTAKKWWSAELSDLRKAVNSKRRVYQRALKRGRPDVLESANEFKAARKKLKGAIIKQKMKAWAELCSTVDTDIWGIAYKTVMRTIKPRPDPPNLTIEKTC
ncbi:uncharacterized protein LOC143350197 [Colletes latitarsis]|uniref:uncharacterized protein LOC143350197 n=1 Tax=Colletes latitarsis TaxID=2605962 RepID=UPI0040374D07